MKHVRVIATWRSEHLVGLDDDAHVADFVQLLGGQSNVELIGYTAQPLHEAVDAAVEELLGPESAAGES